MRKVKNEKRALLLERTIRAMINQEKKRFQQNASIFAGIGSIPPRRGDLVSHSFHSAREPIPHPRKKSVASKAALLDSAVGGPPHHFLNIYILNRLHRHLN